MSFLSSLPDEDLEDIPRYESYGGEGICDDEYE